jgi:hypothetical protein
MGTFTLESLYGPQEQVVPETQPEAQSVDQDIEVLEILRQRGEDPTKLFPRGEKGFFGRADVFPIEQEQLMSPELREFVSRYYGPAEAQIPLDPDAGWIERKWVELLGRPLTEKETEEVQRAQRLKARGSKAPQDVMARMWSELEGRLPSSSEMVGDLPEGFDDPDSENYIPPYLRDMAVKPYKAELPETRATVLQRDWLIGQPTPKDKKVLARTKKASNAINELESLAPGLAASTLGEMLAEDYNKEYRTTGEDLVTAEQLDIKGMVFQGKNQLTFYHPDRKQVVALDAAALEFSDFASILPEVMVIGSDIGGSVLGALGGFTVGGPKGAAVGSWVGGAMAAFFGRLKALDMALNDAEFKFNEKAGGWVKEGFIDKDGQPGVITFDSLMMRAKDDALWSFGGGVLASTLFKLGRSVFSRGAKKLRGSVSEESFIRAVDNWNKQTGGSSNARVNLSTVLDNEADEVYRQATKTGLSREEQRQLYREAATLREQAKILRQKESMVPEAIAQEQTTLAGLKRSVIEEGRTTAERVQAEEAGDLGQQVARGLTQQTTLQIRKEADDIIAQNDAAMAAFARQTETIDDVPEAVGKSFWEKAQAVMGTPDGDVGIYGAYNLVRRNMRTASTQYKGRPIAPFDITSIAKTVNRLHGSKTQGTPWAPGMKGGLPGEFMDEHNKAFTLTVKKGTDKIPVLKGDVPTMVRYDVIDENLKSIRAMIADPNISQAQRSNLKQIHDEYVKIRDATLKDLDTQFGTKNLKLVQNTDKHFSRLSEIWQKNLFDGMSVGKVGGKEPTVTFEQWSKRLFKGEGASDKQFVEKILRDLKPGKDQTELLRQLLLYRYKKHMRGAQRGGTSRDVNVTFPDETTRPMGLEDKGITVTPANEATHVKFFEDNSAWIESLFKKGEWENLTNTVTTSANLKSQAKALDNFNQALQNSPLGRTGLFRLSDKSPSQIVIDDPQKLLDVIFSGGAGTPERGMRSLMDAVSKLPKAEQVIAQERLRALTMRRIFNPLDPEPVAKGQQLMPPDAFKATENVIEELNKNKPTYKAIFGKDHVNDMISIFNRIHLLGRRGMSKEELNQDMAAAAALGGVRWYVGVLNARARALTQTQKVLGINVKRRMREALMNPDKAAQIVQLGKVNLRTKLGVNLLGQILGLNQQDTEFAINAFSTISPFEAGLEAEQ